MIDLTKILGVVESSIDKVANKVDKVEVLNEATAQLNELYKEGAEIVKLEVKGNRLQRNWRPITALTFVFIIVNVWFVFPLLNLIVQDESFAILIKEMQTNERFWVTFGVMVGGYIGVRSVFDKRGEKITNTISEVMKKRKFKNPFKRNK